MENYKKMIERQAESIQIVLNVIEPEDHEYVMDMITDIAGKAYDDGIREVLAVCRN